MKETRAEKRRLLRVGFSNNHTQQNIDGPRWSRRSKLLPSGVSARGKTRKLRNKYRLRDGVKTLVLSK